METDVAQTLTGKSRATKKTTRAMADAVEEVRTGLQADDLRADVTDHLRYSIGRLPAVATPEHYYRALALAVRDRMQQRWTNTTQTYWDLTSKVACYLSAEFLMGPHLGNNLLNLHVEQEARTALAGLGQDLDTVLACEEEPGLGNGGLGRLAACYLDSLATLQRPAIGYGIRYEFGIFDQEIRDGWQVEKTDNWLVRGNPWEIVKPDVAYRVNWGGHTEHYVDDAGGERVRWVPNRVIKGIAYDTPIQGYGVNTCNTLRLWSARAVESFAFEAFNVGDYYRAVEDKVVSETVTKVLYPNDEPEVGKQLRLLQQYFFVSCSLQDVLHMHQDIAGRPVEALPDQFALQLNDTHPSIGVAELMRLLVDEHHLGWDDAWAITEATFGYTNHTLLPEALETWPLQMLGEFLPRHLEIIYEINRRFLDEVRARFPGDEARVRRMSLIGEEGGKSVRMAHLATVGSHAVNGVAALHSELLKSSVLKDFYELWPQRFSNKTNGVTPRRFRGAGQPGTQRAARPHDRGRLAGRLEDASWARVLCRRRRVPPRVARGQARQQGAPCRLRALEHRYRAATGLVVRRPGQADSRVQASGSQRPAHHHAVSPAQAEPRPRDSAACVHLRRESRTRLFPGQAHHQADQRRRRNGEQRPGRQPVPKSGVRAQLQRADRTSDLPGRRSVRADLDRRQGGLGHRQHEVHAQRRVDDRHARRCQRRDSRRGRCGELLLVRVDGAGGRADQVRGLPAGRLHRTQ